MATGEPSPLRRSAALHNFKMPTPWLTWGNQKLLRCSKVAAVDHRSNSTSSGFEYRVERKITDFDFKNRSSIPKLIFKKNKFVVAGGKDDGIGIGIDAVREKLMADLRNAAESMKREMLKQNDKDEERDDMEVEDMLPKATTADAVEEEAVERPWNLRTRRAACKAPVLNEKISVSPLKADNSMKSSRLRSSGCNNGEKTEARAKLSVSLSKKEIEEDFLMMIGDKPPRRPKKRPRTVQKQIDTIYPGQWLCEVTAEMYKVEEFQDVKKK